MANNGHPPRLAFFRMTSKTDQTGQMLRLFIVFPGHTFHFVGVVMKQLNYILP